MYDYKIIKQVRRRPKPMSGILKTVMVVLGSLFVLMAIFLSRGFMLPGFLLIMLYLFFDIFSQREYEYTLEGPAFSIDVILGRRYRRKAHKLNLRELEILAPNWHESVSRYRRREGTEKLRKFDYTSYDDEIPYYTMIIIEEGQKKKFLLDLDEEMLGAMKRFYPEKVIFA